LSSGTYIGLKLGCPTVEKTGMSERKTFRRWRYIIDWRPQVSATSQILGCLAGMILIHAVGILYATRTDAFVEMDANDVTQLLLKANAIYFVVSAFVLGTLMILLTHRFAGPGFVIERAVRNMLEGKYDSRIKLRKRDYMQSVAAAVEKLRVRLKGQDEALRDLRACLEEKDVEGAREILARLSGSEEKQPESEAKPATESVSA